ncbi:MAG: SDR family oxidoreductase [Planctomycetes bacterium]|nr:SDR family oxidoreductase [Planctomycetota bacterium]
MNEHSRKIVIVTGASSGIGQQTALAFARRGDAVVLAARRAERLETVAAGCRAAGAQTLIVPTDVAQRGQVQALADRTIEAFGRIDVLVNNAGYGMFGAAADLDEAALRRIFDVNFFGVWYGLAAVAPVMVRQGGGHIFNVSSVIGKRGTPLHGGYCATKFAVSGLTESARVELRPHRVWVTLVCPALTATAFFDADTMTGRSGRMRRHGYYRFQTPQSVAAAIVRTAGRYRPQLVLTGGGKLLALLAAIAPGLTDRMMERYRRDLVEAMGEDRTAEAGRRGPDE